jgi:hypothetical protein
MFLIEGLFTVRQKSQQQKEAQAELFLSVQLAVGLASFFMLPPGPSQTKSKWFPKGYFSDREVKIIVNRTVREGEPLNPLNSPFLTQFCFSIHTGLTHRL